MKSIYPKMGVWKYRCKSDTYVVKEKSNEKIINLPHYIYICIW